MTNPQNLPQLPFEQLVETIGAPVRCAILGALSDGEFRMVNEIAQMIGQKPGLVSKHLAVLRGAGLVESARQKNQIIYRVADERVFDMCAVVCDGIFKQIKSQQLLLAEGPAAARLRKAGRQGVTP